MLGWEWTPPLNLVLKKLPMKTCYCREGRVKAATMTVRLELGKRSAGESANSFLWLVIIGGRTVTPTRDILNGALCNF